ncbi:MAG: DUF6051 family protein [Bacteroidales bacterium]|nr:DUF6051 family protein [Bacteroidales bacterium]MDD3665536.1 DUF6051 family protein [Bacteroidales bacterium]
MTYHELNELFAKTTTGTNRLVSTNTSTLMVQWIDYKSQQQTIDLKTTHLHPENNDNLVSENYQFKYPIISPVNYHSGSKALLLLHGLNERSWNKYWSWGAWLAEELQLPVILFPISFHMNRSPAFWSNARTVSDIMNHEQTGTTSSSTTFVNYMISKRLTSNPLRFLTSGLQSVNDIYQLINQIQNDKIAQLQGFRQVEVVAYSIGAFLSQIMMLNNFLTSTPPLKTFVLAGGAPFSAMNGISKYIMNKEAFHSIYNFYMYETQRQMKAQSPLGNFLKKETIGQAFDAMTAPTRNSRLIKEAFNAYRKMIKVITLKQDRVIPSGATKKLFRGTMVEVVQSDFKFAYCHENPFPISKDASIQSEVDMAFDNIFKTIKKFITY